MSVGGGGALGSPRMLTAAIGSGLVVAAVTATMHPLAGIVLVIAGLAGAVMLWRPDSAALAYAFLIPLVPTYFRIPGASFIHPLSLLLMPLLALAVLRLALRPCELRWSPLHTLAAAFLLAVMVSSIHEQFDGTTAREIYYQTLVPLVGFAVVFQSIRREDQVDRYLAALTTGAAVTGIYGVAEYVVGRNWIMEKFLIEAAPDGANYVYFTKDTLPELAFYRISSTFINAIEFATLAGMMLPFAVLAAIHHDRPRQQWMYGSLAVLLFLSILLTFSRGALLAVIVCGAIIFLREQRFRRVMIPLGVVAVLAALTAYPLYADKLAARIGDVGTVSTRWGLYRLAFWMFLDNPALGIGYGNFKHFIVEYAQRHGAYDFAEPPEWFTLCENTYLQLLSEMGLVGLVCHLAILATFGWLCLRAMRMNGDRGWHAMAIGLGGLAYALNGLGSGSVILYFQATQAFWVLLALAAHIGGPAVAPREHVNPGSDSNVAGTVSRGTPGTR